MKLAAFAARAENADSLAGTVAVGGDGETFDVGEALDKGKGTIVVVAGSQLERALDAFDGLKSADVPKGAKPVNPDDDAESFAGVTEEAAELASRRGVNLREVKGTGANGKVTVDDVQAAHEAALGIAPAAPAPSGGPSSTDGEES